MAPTTPAMVEAAQDAYDVAVADWQVARARLMDPERVDASVVARFLVASAARQYAYAVLVSVMRDAETSAA